MSFSTCITGDEHAGYRFFWAPRSIRNLDCSVLGGPKAGLCGPTDMEMHPFRVVDQFPARQPAAQLSQILLSLFRVTKRNRFDFAKGGLLLVCSHTSIKCHPGDFASR